MGDASVSREKTRRGEKKSRKKLPTQTSFGKKKRRKQRDEHPRRQLSLDPFSWMEDYNAVTSYFERYSNLGERVEQHGGLLRVEHFLPKEIATCIFETLRDIPDSIWIETAAKEDASRNNINHCFYSCKTGTVHLDLILRLFSVIFPDELSVFSAAKYVGENNHCIERHDDRAYVPVKMEDTGKVVMCCRKMALVYYCGNGPDNHWDGKTQGGMFVDCEDPTSSDGTREYAPDFNTLVAFEIPRYHIVTKVANKNTRYSVFGWTLEPGTSLYKIGD